MYYGISLKFSGFQVLMTVVMKNSFFLDITPFSPVKVNRRCRETCHFHLQGWSVSLARNSLE
jgi:hypothetical protein